eukprot:4099977-Prymnesium_polylepis.1
MSSSACKPVYSLSTARTAVMSGASTFHSASRPSLPRTSTSRTALESARVSWSSTRAPLFASTRPERQHTNSLPREGARQPDSAPAKADRHTPAHEIEPHAQLRLSVG